MKNNLLYNEISSRIRKNKQIHESVKDFIIDFAYDVIVNEKYGTGVDKLQKLEVTPITFKPLEGRIAGVCDPYLVIKNKLSVKNKIYIDLNKIKSASKLKEVVAHEIGHLFGSEFQIKGNNIKFLCGVGNYNFEYIKETGEIKELNSNYCGIMEAINSLRTSDRLTRMNIEHKPGYAIGVELLSIIRNFFSLKKEIDLADETHNLNLIFDKIKASAVYNNLNLSDKELLSIVVDTFEVIRACYIDSNASKEERLNWATKAAKSLLKLLKIDETITCSDPDEMDSFIDHGVVIKNEITKAYIDDFSL